MRTLFATLLLTLATAASAASQTTVSNPSATRLLWDHDGVNTTHFQIGHRPGGTTTFTNGSPLAKDGPEITPAAGGFSGPFPAITPGLHEIVVTALQVIDQSNTLTSPPSNILMVRVVVVPVAPSNLRLVVAKFVQGIGWVPTLQVG